MSTSNFDPVLTPVQFVRQVKLVLPLSVPEEQAKLVQHARAWALVTYQGKVPPRLKRQLAQWEKTYGVI